MLLRLQFELVFLHLFLSLRLYWLNRGYFIDMFQIKCIEMLKRKIKNVNSSDRNRRRRKIKNNGKAYELIK